MVEFIESAREELKRADHSIYVSLKYTRTVDVMKNTVKRLLSAFDIVIVEVLEYAKEKKKLKEIPTNARQRAETIKDLFPEQKKMIEFYLLMKRIDRAGFGKRDEYRKGVTLIVNFPEKTLNVDVETLISYFKQTVIFVEMMYDVIRTDMLSKRKKAVKKTKKK